MFGKCIPHEAAQRHRIEALQPAVMAAAQADEDRGPAYLVRDADQFISSRQGLPGFQKLGLRRTEARTPGRNRASLKGPVPFAERKSFCPSTTIGK